MSDSNRLLINRISNDTKDSHQDQRLHSEKVTKGVIMSFGFKRRSPIDKNEQTTNQNKLKDSDCMKRQESINIRKDSNNSTVNRFGFRYHPTHSRLTNDQIDYSNNNNHGLLKNRGKSTQKSTKIVNTNTVIDSNRNKVVRKAQYSQLPKPQSVFYSDPKIAKTLMNTTRKIAGNYHEDYQNYKSRNCSYSNSSKETSPVDYNNDECANKIATQKNTAKVPQHLLQGVNCDMRFPSPDDTIKQTSEKLFIKPSALETYLKKKSTINYNTSPEEWPNGGGEAMADDVSFAVLAIEKCTQNQPLSLQITTTNTIKSTTKLKSNIPLTLEDPKFAAIAAASTHSSFLLDDETSPVESLISTSESDELVKSRKNQTSTDSKDINEKSTPSPGTPTNVSSFSDGKEDFLIDDEIADQPALVFHNTGVISKNLQDGDLQKLTPKLKRRTPLCLDFSSLSTTNRNSFGSLENLSSCDSLTSDDLMIDYDSNCSSGIEDNDMKLAKSQRVSKIDKRTNKKEKTVLVGNYVTETVTIRSSDQLQRTSAMKTLCKNIHSSPSRNIANLPKTRDVVVIGNDEDTVESEIKREEITNIKTMLLQLKHILNESEAQMCLDNYQNLRDNSNNLRSLPCLSQTDIDDFKMELTEMKRQILFLQGQLEDKEMNLKQLKDEMAKISTSKHFTAQFINFAAQSTRTQHRCDETTCNAATQTDRVRPVSANLSPVEDNAQSLGRFQADNGNTSLHYVSSVSQARLEDLINYGRNKRSGQLND